MQGAFEDVENNERAARDVFSRAARRQSQIRTKSPEGLWLMLSISLGIAMY